MEGWAPTLQEILFSENFENPKTNAIVELQFGAVQLEKINYSQKEARKLNRFELLHTTDGSGSFSLAMSDYQIENNSIYFGYPGQVISNIELNEIEGYILYADSDFMLSANPELLDTELFQLYGRKHQFKLPAQVNEKLLSLAYDLILETSKNLHNHTKALESLLSLHILHTDRYYHQLQESEDSNLHPKVRAFFALMNLTNNPNAPVSEYANQLNISPNYLNDLVKKNVGQTVKTLLKEKTIRKACVLLIHTDLGVKEITYQLGYNYPQYFDLDFKKACGLTPLQYREQHR